MVLCIVAAIALTILGLFSAKYRQAAKEAWKCVFRMATLRPCEADYDEKVKAAVVASVLPRSKPMARFIHKNFKPLSWLLVLLTLASLAYTIYGVYLFALYGNCNGPDSSEFCIYRGLLGGTDYYSGTGGTIGSLIPPANLQTGHALGTADAKITLVEFGCFSCPYTKKAEPTLKQVLSAYGQHIRFIYKVFPLPNHPFSHEAAEAAECADDQGKYWPYHDALFDRQADWREKGLPAFLDIARSLGLDSEKFAQCFQSHKYDEKVDASFQEGLASRLYGTPTFFINGKPLVGPEPFDNFRSIIEDELKK